MEYSLLNRKHSWEPAKNEGANNKQTNKISIARACVADGKISQSVGFSGKRKVDITIYVFPSIRIGNKK